MIECPNCGKRFQYRPSITDGKEYIVCEFCGAELQIDILENNTFAVSETSEYDPTKGARELQRAINKGCREMKREEMIIHWMDIISAVFKAEDNIKDEWYPKLQASKNSSKIVKEQIADAYLRAIATEILDNTNWKMEE